MNIIKLKDIINAESVLDSIAKNRSLPTKVAYNLYILLSNVKPSLDFFYNKKLEIFETFGTQDGENIVIPPENQESFLAALNDLYEIECEKDVEKIDINLDIDLGISPADFFLLTPFINFIE